MKLLQTRIETFIKHIQSREFSQLYYSFKRYVIMVPSNSNSEFKNMLVQPINACVLICFDLGCSTIDLKGIWGQNFIPVFMTFSKFYGQRALHIQKFAAFCSAFTKVCEFGFKWCHIYLQMYEKFHPWVSLYSTNFYQSNLLSLQMNKDKSDVKKNLFPIQRFEKKSPRQPQNFFSLKNYNFAIS